MNGCVDLNNVDVNKGTLSKSTDIEFNLLRNVTK